MIFLVFSIRVFTLARSGSYLRLKNCDESVVLRELGLKVVTKTLLDHPDASFTLPLSHKGIDSDIQVADLGQTVNQFLRRRRYNVSLISSIVSDSMGE